MIVSLAPLFRALLLIFVIGLAGTGCASVINGTTQEVAFRSVPPGATVTVSGQTGTTPTTLSLSRDRDHTATLSKEGHPERQVNIKQKLSGAFYGNLALGGIIGMSVDMGNGAAYNLTPSNVEVDMATGLVREFDKDEPPTRVAEAPPPSPLGPQAAPAVTTLVSNSPPMARAAPLPTTTDTGLRYIAPNKGGGGFVLWTDLAAYTNCVAAITRGTEQSRKMYCEDGPAGIRPKVGDIAEGTEVELLEIKDCGTEMVRIRVLAGPYKGETGCLAPIGLTRIKTG